MTRAVKKILFPVDFSLLSLLTPYMHKAEHVFGETAEAGYADVFSLGRTSATIGPFELAQSHLLACARLAVVGLSI